MNIKSILSAALLVGTVIGLTNRVEAQIPTNFPTVTVTTNYAAGTANGYIFLANNIAPTNIGYYVMMLTNDGSPTWYKALTNSGYDFKVLPNGYLHYAQQIKALSYTGGGDVTHEVMDENHNTVESIHGGNGYAAEAHDFQMLPNGNVLQFGYYLSEVDMSQVVSNGNPAALVSGAVLQELDAQRTVVFQWRSWDYYPFTSQWVNSTAAVISQFHVNCIMQDTDGNIIISTPEWVKKISRQTGDIMWHLGGPENQFTFVGVTQQQGTNHFRGHAINRLPNGHVLIYNNSAPGPGTTSTVHEYALDETNKIATHIWTYTPNPAIAGPNQGNAQRLANGNTFVGWGGAATAVCTEVAGTDVVFQAKFNTPNVNSYRSYKFAYPPASQANENSITEVTAGNTYTFGSTGVTLEMVAGGGGYNRLTVTRFPYAPIYPLFQGKAPRVLPVRVQLSETSLDSLTANIDFDASSFGISDPSNITIAYRGQSGQGLFVPQTTTYNPVTGKLSVNIALSAQAGDLGEFIFTYPDLADIPFPPILAQAENYRGVQLYNVTAPKVAATGTTYNVNQQLPILLSWSPKGLSRYSEFELATDVTFSTPLLQMPFQTDAFYVWNGAAPNTTYYYRVRTHNDGGVSGWSVGSFRTIAPYVTMVFPNGGELFRRGLRYFVKWQDNIPENINLDLYKGGARLRGIVTNAPSSGAFQWQVPLDLTPGSDYSIKIISATNSAMADFSDQPFSIDAPLIDTKSIARLPDGSFSFGFTAYGSTQVVVAASSDFVLWQDLGLVNLTNGVASFVDTSVTNFPMRFYRLRLP
jgi:Developmentally Regulated MAPK Interacting Protein./Arylsulfotransferase (ASST).